METLKQAIELKYIADEVRAERHRKRVTQEELSEMSGVGMNTIVSLEKGNGTTLNNLLRMCESLNLRIKLERRNE